MENSSSLFSAGKAGFLRKPFYFVTVTNITIINEMEVTKMKSQLADFYECLYFQKGSHCSVI